MLCIICNENPEKVWPKRWQCWKDNGKFSESLCKLLGLPTFPYKTDFQNSVYCSTCQKRVYNVYLMMRKWDKLQDDISKLKSRLKKDFEQSLQKGDTTTASNSSSGEENEKTIWGYLCPNDEKEKSNSNKVKGNNGENSDDSSASYAEINTVVRKRILKRLDRNWDCDCCCDTGDESPNAEASAPIKKGKSHCGFPNCQDKDCQMKWNNDETANNNANSGDEDDDSASSSSSGSGWSSHHESECDYELCKLCCTSAEGHIGKMGPGPEHNSTHNNDPCSSEYCADCSICKYDAKQSQDLISKNKRVKNWTVASCKATNVKSEALKGDQQNQKSPDETYEFTEESVAVDSFSFGKKNTHCVKDSGCAATCKKRVQHKDRSFDENCTTADLNEENGEGNSNGTSKLDNNAERERYRCFTGNCTRTFPSQDELDIHVKRHHEGIRCPYVCEQCGKAFQWRRELNSHVLKHSGEVAVWCDLCGRGFRTKHLYSVHMKTKHADAAERKYKCSMCDKSFISESKLNTHLTIHTKVYPFICTICGKGFSAKTFLNFHMSKHMEANPYKCATCDKTFSSPRNLKVHQYTHTNSHPYKCTICQAGVTSETLLKKHMLKHNNEKSNVCHICNKKFRFPSSLKKHQKVHTGEKKFMCEFCNKTFIDKYKLTRHLRTHSGDEPYYCTICKKSFATKEYLNQHNVQNHSHEEPETETNENENSCISSSSFDPSMDLPSIDSEDLQMLDLDDDDQLGAYLPDGYPTDPSFLENLNPEDHDLVTALNLENFSNDELMMTDKEPDDSLQLESNLLENLVPNTNTTTVLPNFQSLRRSSGHFTHDFPMFSFQQMEYSQK